MWEIVETKAGEVRMAKAEGRRREKRSRKKKKKKEKGKETKRNGSMKDSRRVGDLG